MNHPYRAQGKTMGPALSLLLAAMIGLLFWSRPVVAGPSLEETEMSAAVEGLVQDDETGQPIPHAFVALFDPETPPAPPPARLEESALAIGESDETGHYVIPIPAGLPAGPYKVGAFAPGYRPQFYNEQNRWDAAQPVTAPAGQIDFFLVQAEHEGPGIPDGPSGSLSGTVLDAETQQPIANVHVGLFNPNTSPETQPAFSGQTNTQGNYRIEHVPIGEYIAGVHAPGYRGQFYDGAASWEAAQPVTVVTDTDTAAVDFALVPGDNPPPPPNHGGCPAEMNGNTTIVGTVVLPDGSPVPHAALGAHTGDWLRQCFTGTTVEGEFHLRNVPAGEWRLQAGPPHPDGQEDGADSPYLRYTRSAERAVTVDEAIEPTTITLSAPLTLTLVNVMGWVALPSGEAAARAGLFVFADADANGYPDPDGYQQGDGADERGFFQLGGLATGRFVLEVMPPGDRSDLLSPEPRAFTITDTQTVVNLGTLTFRSPHKSITGSVVDTAGRGVPDAEVNAHRRGHPGHNHTRTDEDGAFRLGVGPGEWEIMIFAPPPRPGEAQTPANWIYTGRPKVVRFADDQTEEIQTVQFVVETPDALVTGRILDPNGQPLTQPFGVHVDVRNPEGQGNGAPVDGQSRFAIPIKAGYYEVWISTDEHRFPNYAGPDLDPIRVQSGETKNLGDIRLIHKNAAITGRVTTTDGAPVPNVQLHAWRQEGGWANATTGTDGTYQMAVNAGRWEVMVAPSPQAAYVSSQPPQRVEVEDDEAVTVDFEVAQTTTVVQGTVMDSAGRMLADVNAWAYARPENSPEPVAGVPVAGGHFRLNLPAGTYRIGLFLPPGSEYSLVNEEVISGQAVSALISRAGTRTEIAITTLAVGEQRVNAGSGEVAVTIQLQRNNAHVTGTFYRPDGSPAIGLEGDVFANAGGHNSAWQVTRIDPATASFELDVAAGTWNLGYRLLTTDYVPHPERPIRVSVAADETVVQEFTLTSVDATITGVVLDPDGQPLDHVFAWAHRDGSESFKPIDTGTEVEDGIFELRVPAGGQYYVGAHAGQELGYAQPHIQVVTPTSGSTVSVTLQFRRSDATIRGTARLAESLEPLADAFVYAWSEDGQHLQTATGADGRYSLNVVAGARWHIGATWEDENHRFYRTAGEVEVDLVESHSADAVDLVLAPEGRTLPPPVANTFDPSVGWTTTLTDGTRIEIPAGAIPTTDTVRISITPLGQGLVNTLTARPLGYGYAIAIYENSSGEQIVSNFNSSVLLTFYYTEGELERLGITEEELAPAYYSTTTNAWTKVESFTVDTELNQITAQIDHFSTWAPIRSGSSSPTTIPDNPIPGRSIFLPAVQR